MQKKWPFNRLYFEASGLSSSSSAFELSALGSNIRSSLAILRAWSSAEVLGRFSANLSASE